MKLRLGDPVYSTDGLFGEVADIVIDPVQRKVTHLVVEPTKQHSQARLVPIWLISVVDKRVNVALADSFLRQLQRVAFQDFVQVGETVPTDDDWDIGTQEVIAPAYWDAESHATSHLTLISYDRIPKGECEIRRRSEVTTADLHMVGTVEGFLADANDLVAVIVVTGIPGLRNHVAVPMSSVATVQSDRIALSISRREFAALPRSERLGPVGAGPRAALDSVRESAGRLSRKVTDRRQ